MNNSVFGKHIQHNRIQRDIRLVTDERTRNKLASSPRFKDVKNISEN